MPTNKATNRSRRKRRIRKKVTGTVARPRLTVFRSNKHIYAQVVDDAEGRSLAAASTLKADTNGQDKTESAKAVGKALAEACAGKGIKKVVFDRNGYAYHGRISALAEGAREGGLEL